MTEHATLNPIVPPDRQDARSIAKRAQARREVRRRGTLAGRARRAALARRAAVMRRRGGGGGLFRGAIGPGAIVAALAVAALAANRALTGDTTEEVGRGIRDALLGEIGDEALATMDVRGQLTGNQQVLREIGVNGKITAGVREYAEILASGARIKVLGQRRIDEAFPVESMFDVIVDKVSEMLTRVGQSEPIKRLLHEANDARSKGVAPR